MSKSGTELTRAERIELHNRHEAYAEQILEMLVRGETYRAIERATGVPKSTVGIMARRLAKDYVREHYGDHTSVLGRELHILDQLTRKNLGPATRGDESAARIVLASHVRRSKLLGLEAAVKSEITVKTAQDIEIERLVRMMSETAESPAEQPSEPVAGGSE